MTLGRFFETLKCKHLDPNSSFNLLSQTQLVFENKNTLPFIMKYLTLHDYFASTSFWSWWNFEVQIFMATWEFFFIFIYILGESMHFFTACGHVWLEIWTHVNILLELYFSIFFLKTNVQLYVILVKRAQFWWNYGTKFACSLFFFKKNPRKIF